MATAPTETKMSADELRTAGNVRAELARRQIERAEVIAVIPLSRDSIHRRIRGLTPWGLDELRTLADLMAVELSTLTD